VKTLRPFQLVMTRVGLALREEFRWSEEL